MKFLVLVIVLCISCLKSQTQLTNVEKYSSFIKVWGFFKYHHPNLVNNQINMDEVFIEKFFLIKEIETQEKLDVFYEKWISEIGLLKTSNNTSQYKPDALSDNFNFDWIEENFSENKILKEKFLQVNNNNYKLNPKVLNKTPRTSYIEKFNERSYPKEFLLKTEYRLLDLARYWNIINYFYPYKYKINKKWDEILNEILPKFIEYKNLKNYVFNLHELSSIINDSHSYVFTNDGYFGNYSVPFEFKIIDNEIVVSGYLDKEKSIENNVTIGDVVEKVDKKEVKEFINDKIKYAGGSNLQAKLDRLSFFLFRGDSDRILVKIRRDNDSYERNVKRYKPKEFNSQKNPKSKFEFIRNNVAYLSVPELQTSKTSKKELENIFKKIIGIENIIIDLRNYENYDSISFDVVSYLVDKKKHFANAYFPNFSKPSIFNLEKIFTVKPNKKYNYNGRIFLLVDETTCSHMEYIAMMIQSNPKTLTIGSVTSGSVGNTSKIPMVAEGFTTMFTALAFFYPNGEETQNKGVKIDVEINSSVKSIRNNIDLRLEKTIEIIGQ